MGAKRPVDSGPVYSAVVRADTRGDATHIVWNDPASDKVRYRRLDAAGNTVVAPVIVANAPLDGDKTKGVPDVAGHPDGGAYVVWRGPGRTTSYRAIHLARIGSDGRVVWTHGVHEDPTYGRRILDPRIACDADGIAHVVCWQEGTPNAILYATFRPDGMAALGWTAIAGGGTGVRRLPNVAVDAQSRAHLVWYDSTPHGADISRREIYHARLANAGGVPSSTNSIAPKRLTTTTTGYQWGTAWAPELAPDPSGSIHVVWPDQKPLTASKGIAYLRIEPTGNLSISPRRVLDGSVNAPGRPYYGWTAAVTPHAGGARVVAQANYGMTGPHRLWQVDVSAKGAATQPVLVSDGRNNDFWPSLGTGADGRTRLVYMGDTGVLVGGSPRQRVTYTDTLVDARANDRTRGDLEVDSAHWHYTSTPANPRQGAAIRVLADVVNAGWAPVPGGMATLEYDGVPVGTANIPPLAVEASHAVSFTWNIPGDATRTPAALAVRVAPSTTATQTTAANDTAPLPLHFAVPPTKASILVDVFDETHDPDRHGYDGVPTAVAAITGTTAEGAPFAASANRLGGWLLFRDVPLGSYSLVHSAPGYIVSPPAPIPVTIGRNPTDAYQLVVTPGLTVDAWVNRWGRIDGTAVASGGNTPLAGVRVELVGEDRSALSASDGTFAFAKLAEGTYRLKATKAGKARTFVTQAVLPATTHPVTIPMSATTKGYLVGRVLDEAGAPCIGDPDSTADDPTLTVRDSTGKQPFRGTLHDGSFDLELDPGTYTLTFEAPGYVTKTGITATIRAGVETGKTTALELDVSELTHVRRSERWMTAFTAHAEWGGDQSPGSKIDTFDIYQWFGLSRFTLDADYQDVGTNRYIRLFKPRFDGEAWDWHYIKAWILYGVEAPIAPTVFEYGQPPITGSWNGKCQPPMLVEGSRWNRTALRFDGVDIVDQRDGETVARIRSQWYTTREPDGHQYGRIGTVEGDGAFGTYSRPVPWNQQLIRLWITVGRVDPETGEFKNAPFDDISRINMTNLFAATGSSKLMLTWRPSDNAVWVEPALFGYPQVMP